MKYGTWRDLAKANPRDVDEEVCRILRGMEDSVTVGHAKGALDAFKRRHLERHVQQALVENHDRYVDSAAALLFALLAGCEAQGGKR
jgi:hypothetical protein